MDLAHSPFVFCARTIACSFQACPNASAVDNNTSGERSNNAAPLVGAGDLAATQDAAKKHTKRGEVDAAKAAYEFVLDAHSRALGEEHEMTLSVKNSLALVLKIKRR